MRSNFIPTGRRCIIHHRWRCHVAFGSRRGHSRPVPSMGFDIVHDMGIGGRPTYPAQPGSPKRLGAHLMRIPKWRQVVLGEKRYASGRK